MIITISSQKFLQTIMHYFHSYCYYNFRVIRLFFSSIQFFGSFLLHFYEKQRKYLQKFLSFILFMRFRHLIFKFLLHIDFFQTIKRLRGVTIHLNVFLRLLPIFLFFQNHDQGYFLLLDYYFHLFISIFHNHHVVF